MNAPMEVRLRYPEPADAALMVELSEDPALWECGDSAMPLSLHLARRFVDNGTDLAADRQIRLVIEACGEAAGLADLFDYDPLNCRAWVGIAVTPGLRRRGIATAALRELRRWAGRRWGMRTLWATVDAANTPSLRAFEKAGFGRVATLRGWLVRDGRLRDACLLTSPLN